MKKISKIKVGFPDAENYKMREFKTLFNQIFVKDDFLSALLSPQISFLIGEKGTGKTAYAMFLQNNHYKETFANIRFIRETEYQKFITLKQEKHLDLSDYTNIWQVIIYLLLSQQIRERESGVFNYLKFKALDKAIQEFYLHAFSPEIIHALQFVQESKMAAELLSKYANIKGEHTNTTTFSESRFQTNLLFIQKNFENALSNLKLKNNQILFIDGIDIRPSSIPFPEYLECIKGLANAVWHVNHDIFPRFKDSPGRLRVVLLVRPDIFVSLGLQNQNNKIRSNSVLLDWRTTYSSHRKSNIFKLADQLFRVQQNYDLKEGEGWDTYFPYDTPNVKEKFEHATSFIGFLRYSLYRPRDIITMLDILKSNSSDPNRQSFTLQDFESKDFLKKYSNYLLGEVKDHLTFYYSDLDYENFLKFFEFLKGKIKFNYENYLTAFDGFEKHIVSTGSITPKFMKTANDFLQFLFELNVICYKEKATNHKNFIHWSFRERDYSNIAPKVKYEVEYEIFYGFTRALNTGMALK